MSTPAGHIQMTEAELEAANERLRLARQQAVQDRDAAIARRDVHQSPDVALDQHRSPEGTEEGEDGVTTFATEEARQADLDVLMGLREMSGADLVRWKIFRMSDPTGRKATGYLATWPNTLLSTEKIQQDFGAGTYRIVGTYQNGKYAARRTIEIAEDSLMPSRPAPAPVLESGSGSSSMSEFMTMMLQQNEQRRQEDADRERREEAREERRRRERMEMMQIAAPVVAAIVPALLGNRGPDVAALIQATKGPSLAETLTVIRELTPQPAPAGVSPIDTALKLFDKFTDLAPKAGGETGWADVLKEVVRSVGPGVAPMMGQLAQAAQRQRERQAAQPLPPRSLPAPIAPAPDLYGGMSRESDALSAPVVQTDSAATVFHPDGAEPQVQGDAMNPIQLMKLVPWMKDQLQTLVRQAARDGDPEVYADVIWDNIPEGVSGDVLLDFLKKPDYLATLAQLDARVQEFPEWFNELRGEIVKTGEAMKAAVLAASQGTPAATPASVAPQSAGPQGPDLPTGPPSLTGG